MLRVKDGQFVSIEAVMNGKGTARVHVWRREPEETLVVDELRLASLKARERLVKELPVDVQADARLLLQQLATELLVAGEMDNQSKVHAMFTDPEPWPVGVVLAEVLAETAAFILRYVIVPQPTADALAAWIAFTYMVPVFNIAPYVIARSPVKRCGKSLLLEVVELLVHRPFSTVSASPATLFRVIDESAPTVLMDEAETLGGQGERAEAVREILNAGYRRGPGVPRCEGENNEVKVFSVFGPKVLAAIGRLWDTLEDRSVIVELKRKRRDESVERFRRRKAEPVALELRRKLVRWSKDHVDGLRDIEPTLPDFLDDRAQDSWEPLLAIGLAAGDGWCERLVRSAKALSGVRVEEDDAPGVRLLGDLRELFEERRTDKIASADFVEYLKSLPDRQWSEWKGKPITTVQVSRLLRPFGIKPKKVRIGTAVVQGYALEDCQDPISRYHIVTNLERSEADPDTRNKPART